MHNTTKSTVSLSKQQLFIEKATCPLVEVGREVARGLMSFFLDIQSHNTIVVVYKRPAM